MRRLFVILFLITCSVLSATTYYVSTSGDDGNAGTLAAPWATFQYAITNSSAGDTVFFRGGTYYPTNRYGDRITNKYGTAGDPICYFNYPGETPIIDCTNYPTDVTSMWGFQVRWSNYIHVKGITIRNMAQRNPGGLNTGLYIEGSNHVTLENMVIHNVGGYGSVVYISNDILYKNCDAYDLVDPYGENPGNDGDGFLWNFGNDNPDSTKYYTVTYQNCRAWDFGDNGFAGLGGQVTIDGCWAFSGGRLEGAGCGLKYSIGQGTDETNPNARVVKNNIFACNGFYGISPNNNGGNGVNGQFYNNFLYHNGYRRNSPEWDANWGTGLLFFYCEFCTPGGPVYEMFSNNLAYDNEAHTVYDYSGQYLYNHEYNSWDIGGLTITDDDFISLDTLELRLPRKADGSLPDINFGKLVPTSDLIDAGIDVGLDYYGTAPDLGWFESGSELIDTVGYVTHNNYLIIHNGYIVSRGITSTGSDEEPEISQIIADHTVVDKFDEIPQQWIDSVKKMRVSYPGESHARWVQYGMAALETLDSRYQVNVTTTGSPEGATSSRLRMDYFMWGKVTDADSWYVSYGEEDWWANATAISRTKAGLTYMNSNGYDLDAVGFGWCWDEISRGNNISTIDPINGAYWGGFWYNSSEGVVDTPWGLDDADNALTGDTIDMDDYLRATQAYIDYCADSIPTKIFFTTPPTNGGWTTGSDYQATLKAQHIRDYVNSDTTLILFDYADILAYDDNGDSTLNTWNGHTYPMITPTNEGDESEAHIDSPGTLRLAKAMWWMLARMAGWDGN